MSSAIHYLYHLPELTFCVFILAIAFLTRVLHGRIWLGLLGLSLLVIAVGKLPFWQVGSRDWISLWLKLNGILVICSGSFLGMFLLAVWCKSRHTFSVNQLFLSFSGRISRTPYWLAYALQTFVTLATVNLLVRWASVSYLDRDSELTVPPWLVAGCFFPVLIWSSFAIQAKRWRDCNMSGWLVLLCLIPFVGPLIALIVGTYPGSDGDNSYGPDSRQTAKDAP